MKKENNQFEFCKVCKLNHDQGRRHNFFPNHKTHLSSYLSRFQSKLSDVRFYLKNPSLLRPEHASLDRLWCVFCDSDIQEIDSSFACANAINHLASVSHLKSLKNFLWKYGGGMDRIDSFRISEIDLTKWEKKCKLLKKEAAGEGSQRLLTGPVNNIHNELNSDSLYNFDKNSIDDLNSSFSNGVVPLQSHTIEKYQVSHSEHFESSEAGGLLHGANAYKRSAKQTDTNPRSLECLPDYMDNQHAIIPNGRIGSHAIGPMKQVLRDERTTNGEQSFQGMQKLTPVSSILSEEAKGNVHSGGPPPWFNSSEGKQVNEKLRPGNSKLNPKRVGAAWAERRKIEMEMEKRGEVVITKFDSNWLPNFGRVWQSGSRKESRIEFQTEISSSHKDENQAATPVQLQPYVSKRLVSSTENQTEINLSHKDENQTATPVHVQPYVSKRLVGSTENQTEISSSHKDENQTATPVHVQPYVSKRLVGSPNQMENNSSHKDENQAATPAQLQPYVSKRLRKGY